LAAIIGGLGTSFGPFLGATLVTTVETYLRAQFGGMGGGLVGIYLIVYGCALIVIVRWMPQGIVGWVGERWPRRGAVRTAP
jgi:branched-chain amino acid transport system permease protein